MAEKINPRSGKPDNSERADRVSDAIQSYAEECFGLEDDREDSFMVAQDFINDVLHWANQHGVEDLDALLEAALTSFRTEVDQEEVCDECESRIPNTPGGGLANRHHKESCSLYEKGKD